MAAPSSDTGSNPKDSRFLLTLVNERTLERVWILRLTRTGAFLVTGFGIVLLLVLFSCIILFTPLRRLLPKNTEEFREELVLQASRVDSLQTVIDVQTEYLNSLRYAMAGVVSTDTIMPLDSLQLIAQERLAEARAQATEDFMAEHEALDTLEFFDINDETEWKE